MNTSISKKLKFFTLIGFLFFIVPFFYFAYWIYCFSTIANRNEAVEHFKNVLPAFMRGDGSTNFIFVIMAMVALIFAAKGIINKNQLWHKLSLLITFSSGILAFLYLFQMM